ncbi:MAG: hypothetical protein U0R19_08810 [Bryobacteraceae bacterium]
MNYETTWQYESKTFPGVTAILKRISFSKRSELTREIAPLAAKIMALSASRVEAEQTEAALLRRAVAGLVIDWGLVEISGLMIDGVPAKKQTLIDNGPEELTLEILQQLQRQISLSDDEIKN